MSGEIIDFRRLRAQRRATLHCQQPVPRAPAREASRGENPAYLLTIDEQIDRIQGLLGELEALTRDARDVPSTVRARARASVERAGEVLQAVRGGAEESDTDDPQPEVDREVLERMYRDLDLQA
jgi:hypothetical protein